MNDRKKLNIEIDTTNKQIYINQDVKKRKKRTRKKKKQSDEVIVNKEITTVISKEEGISKNKECKNNVFKKKSLIIKISLILLCIVIIGMVFTWNQIVLLINGSSIVNLPVYTNYIDEGVTAKIFDYNLDKQVNITSNLDINKLGNYEITYDLFFHQRKRYVNIIDTTPPEIVLNGDNNVTIYQNEKYVDEGFLVIDNYDGNLSDKVIVTSNVNNSKLGNYKIKYKISDSSGNTTEVVRGVQVVENPIEKYIKKHGYSVSVGYYNLVTGKSYYYNRDKKYYGASLIKVLDAIYLYDKNKVTNELKPYIRTSLSYSNNDSHIYLVNYIGRNTLRKYGLSIGAKYTLEPGYDYYANTVVDDQIAYYKKLYELTKNGKNKELAKWMIDSSCNYLMFNQNAPEALTKYGYYKINFHNAGLVLDDEPYIAVILTTEGERDYYNIIRNIAKKIYEYHEKD